VRCLPWTDVAFCARASRCFGVASSEQRVTCGSQVSRDSELDGRQGQSRVELARECEDGGMGRETELRGTVMYARERRVAVAAWLTIPGTINCGDSRTGGWRQGSKMSGKLIHVWS
jgi:hypothetical protein